MSNYTKTTDFAAKDSLPSGDSGKIIRGSDFETEFDAIATAITSKAESAGPTFTGTLTFETISDGTINVTAFVDEDNMASNSATLIPTQQSVKAYVDAQVATADALSEVLGNGNTTGGTDIAVGTGDDITFADNSKTIFGAGSDLQIFHDGSNNFISSETGSLVIRAQADDNDVVINSDNGSGGTSSYFRADGSTGASILYNYGSEKLATTSTGIDVTGTVTADGLNFDVADGVEINALESLVFDIDSDNNQTSRVFQVKTNNTTPLFTIQDGGNVGIGTSSPDTLLNLESAAPTTRLAPTTQNNASSLELGVLNAGTTAYAKIDAVNLSTYDTNLRFYTNTSSSTTQTERMRITSGGDVGIGVTDMGSAGLSILNSMNFNISEGASSSFVNIFRQASSAATVVANGYKYTDTANKMASSYASSWAKSAMALNYGNIIFYTDSATTTAVGTDVTPTERMRIDSNGVVIFKNGTVQESTTITSSSNAATLNLRDGDNFVHDLTENVTYTFSNPGSSGTVSAFSLKVIQGATARTITWPSSVDWAGGTAPTLSTANDAVDVFVFFTHDGGTTYYGFTAGQAMA